MVVSSVCDADGLVLARMAVCERLEHGCACAYQPTHPTVLCISPSEQRRTATCRLSTELWHFVRTSAELRCLWCASHRHFEKEHFGWIEHLLGVELGILIKWLLIITVPLSINLNGFVVISYKNFISDDQITILHPQSVCVLSSFSQVSSILGSACFHSLVN